ncbi:MAG: efflux RND transporter periplasmic adaptor subunit [Paracoccus sp. (in: a-proteobacteria)]|nr:efflux RND transporter periplasmic adaptor subunit [Paracoccus sp. (in: a-proteobacteria)]
MIKRLIIAILALALVGGGLVWFNLFRDKMIQQFFSNMPVQTLPVNTITVEPVTWHPKIEAIGTVNAAQGIDLTVETAGIVREIGFRTNQRVEEGDLLVRLDDVTQLADVESARVQLELSENALNRARQLQRRGVAAEASLESAEASFRTAEAALARSEVGLQTRRLVAPFGGIIGLPQVDPGAYITPGTIIATLQDLDSMRVDFSLPEQDLPVLRIGQPLSVTLDEYAQEFHGKITGIDPRVDASSRMVALRGEIEIEIEGTQSALTPGQFVRINVALPEETGIIALPQTSVISSLYGDYVYVVREKDERGESGETLLEVRQVFVQPGRRSGGLIEISGNAINPGDEVVTSGQNRLTNGAQVRIDNSVTPDGQGQTPPPAAGDTDATAAPASEDADATPAPAGDTDTDTGTAAEDAAADQTAADQTSSDEAATTGAAGQ